MLQLLADKMAITDVIHQYSDCVDRRDFTGVLDCFHEDGTYEYQEGGEQVPVALFFEAQADAGTGFRETMHHLTNIRIKLDGDSALTQTYILAHHRMKADCPDLPPLFPNKGKEYGVLIGARYVDDMERRDGCWKIRNRALFFEWDLQIDAPQVCWSTGGHSGCYARSVCLIVLPTVGPTNDRHN